MHTKEARQLGQEVTTLIQRGQIEAAYARQITGLVPDAVGVAQPLAPLAEGYLASASRILGLSRTIEATMPA